jgi:hypothetical protein
LLRSFEAGVKKSEAMRIHGMSEECVTLFYNTVRVCIRDFMMRHPVVFPPDEIVEIDECHLNCLQRREIDEKTGKTRRAKKGAKTWVIGLIGRKTQWVALSIASDHTTETIQPLIDRHLPDRRTVTISDKDRSFLYLQKEIDCGWYLIQSQVVIDRPALMRIIVIILKDIGNTSEKE